jgi:hypothetical protein
MTSASKATVVIGFPLAGPTCSAITPIPVQSRAGDLGLCVYATGAIDSYSRPFFHTAQAMRASLLASATAALLWRLRF